MLVTMFIKIKENGREEYLYNSIQAIEENNKMK